MCKAIQKLLEADNLLPFFLEQFFNTTIFKGIRKFLSKEKVSSIFEIGSLRFFKSKTDNYSARSDQRKICRHLTENCQRGVFSLTSENYFLSNYLEEVPLQDHF